MHAPVPTIRNRGAFGEEIQSNAAGRDRSGAPKTSGRVRPAVTSGSHLIRPRSGARSTTQRLSMREVDPEAQKAVFGLSQYVGNSGLAEGLRALEDIQASQINHCAWCLDMHVTGARNAGVEQR